MSAWVVCHEHIDVLIKAGLREGRVQGSPLRWFVIDPNDPSFDYSEHVRELTHANADEVGRLLWTENVCSVAYRYPDDTPASRPGPRSEDIDADAIAYRYHDPGFVPTPGELFKTVDCYDYQSCEHPGWRDSEARRFCQALVDRYTSFVDGYEAAPWGWGPEEVTQRGTVRRAAA